MRCSVAVYVVTSWKCALGCTTLRIARISARLAPLEADTARLAQAASHMETSAICPITSVACSFRYIAHFAREESHTQTGIPCQPCPLLALLTHSALSTTLITLLRQNHTCRQASSAHPSPGWHLYSLMIRNQYCDITVSLYLYLIGAASFTWNTHTSLQTNMHTS